MESRVCLTIRLGSLGSNRKTHGSTGKTRDSGRNTRTRGLHPSTLTEAIALVMSEKVANSFASEISGSKPLFIVTGHDDWIRKDVGILVMTALEIAQ